MNKVLLILILALLGFMTLEFNYFIQHYEYLLSILTFMNSRCKI